LNLLPITRWLLHTVSKPTILSLKKAIMVTIYVCNKTILQILNPLPANGEL
jgi:hypothetical protein